ncbi:MAG: F0F1 ATP synthase subunit A [Acetobacter sp.]|nr:F0F1 ATP synthase subunit A [Bacteroides sp.]MCM1341786.1 F0F1 ATP synthase subunit A [Acetobacter sp.]MCM1433129.1 F0F1 ATP synthase subunit A [Clostridiales bacterium]
MKLDLQAELSEQLEIEEVFGFDLGSIHIGFDESTVVSWIIIAVLTIVAIILTRNLKVTGKISKRQQLLEFCYEKSVDFFKGILGPKVENFIPWLMSMALFIGVSNMMGLFGMKPPTKSMQVTLAMALTSIVIIEYASIKDKGFIGRIKAFAKPTPIVAPINILEILTKPLSLCMRLFGNIIGAFIIMELIKAIPVLKVGVPVVFSLYFDLFDALLQAYIFVFLTALYIQEAVEEEEEPAKDKQTKKMKKLSKKAKKKAAKTA